MTASFLAVDWGTTNVRAWVVDAGGGVTISQDFPLGVSRLGPGEAAQRFEDTVRPALKAAGLPAVMCGMIGSNLGWELAPYFDCPADLDTLSGGMRRVAALGPPVFIVPGLRCRRADGEPDVMRGEEVQILGWAAGAPDRAQGPKLICHPGTHTKWVRLTDGRIDNFVTAMTGELFDVLRRHSVLKAPADSPTRGDEAAFDAGLKAAGDGGALASRLFTGRARVATGEMDAAVVESYLSGILVGADVAATQRLLGAEPGEPVILIGDETLCRHYGRALAARGVATSTFDGDEAALAGLTALYRTELAR